MRNATTVLDSPVDWSSYAAQYDLLASHNPAYRELHAHCLERVRAWDLGTTPTIADFGAGTGNFSISIAAERPDAQVLHLENDPEMLARARARAAARGLRNWTGLAFDLEDAAWDRLPPLAGAVTVNALYSLRKPQDVVQRIARAVAPGGWIYASSFGRPLRVGSWTLFLLRHNLRTVGLRGSWHLLRATDKARAANRAIRAAQSTGRYWCHDLDALVATFAAAPATTVLEATDVLYRGCNDTVVARRRVA